MPEASGTAISDSTTLLDIIDTLKTGQDYCEAIRFYEAVGFLSSPSDPMMLMVGLHDLNRALGT
jgi:hypothetical protein